MQLNLRLTTVVAALAATTFALSAERSETLLRHGWQFTKGHGDALGARWESVSVPHDWAIYGPFDIKNDLQTVAVEQNGEKEKTLKTGRTGGLPFIGTGEYRTTFTLPDDMDGRSATLVFDGAMSHARVK